MKQRVQYHLKMKGQKSQMTDEKISKLEAVDFAWVAPGYKARKRQRTDDDD